MTTSILGPSLGFSDGSRPQAIEDAYVAVYVGPESKVRARLLADNPRFNVAVVWVAPEAVKGFEPLSLVRAKEVDGQPPAAGDQLRIVCPAIGQPAHHATGQIERVRKKTIILQTGLNPSFFGCPAMNARGEVVGFASDRVRMPMARLYRIEVARKALSEAREKVTQSQPPPLDPLPLAAPIPYPEAALAKAASQRRDAVVYHAQSDRGTTLEFLTPPLIRSLAVGQDWADGVQEGSEIRYRRDSGFFWWQRHAGRTDPVVIIQAVPPMRKDPESVALTTTGWIFALPSCGQSLDSVDISYRFEPQFAELILFKDGTRVAPIHPGRVCSVFLVRMMKDPDDTAWRDMVFGCYGAYEYAWDLFQPGAHLSVRVVLDDRTEAEDFELSPQLIERIRSDFEPYDSEGRPASSSEMSPGS